MLEKVIIIIIISSSSIIVTFIIIKTEYCYSVSWKYKSFQYHVYSVEPVLALSS